MEQTLEPQKPADNVWFWKDDECRQLIYTLKVDVPSAKDGGLLKAGEVYKLLIEWEFYHDVPTPTGGGPRRHCEPFSGFDDNITFKVGQETIL